MLTEKRLPVRYVWQKLRQELLYVVVIATTVDLALEFLPGVLPPLPPAIPAFLGTAISLLLSFKLNQSYDRWWEARKIWGAIVNDSRTLVRQLLALAAGDMTTVRRIGHRQIAWCYVLGQSLRGLDWRVGTAGLLSDEELEAAAGHANKALFLMQRQATDLAALARAGHLTDFQHLAIEDTLTRLTASMGMAERIRSTVFPRTYRAFLHAFIYLFITALSVALVEVQGPWQILVTVGIASPFLLLEKTATHMQDPFANRPTDTSVTAIARTIEIGLRQLLGDPDIPDPVPMNDFYVM